MKKEAKKPKTKYCLRKDGRIQHTITAASGKRITFYGRSDAEIEQKMLDWDADQRAGRMFTDVADAWETNHFKNLAEGTKVCYRPALKRAKEFFDGKRCGTIRPIEIDRMIASLSGGAYSHQTVHVQLSCLRQIFDYAVLAGDCSVNPCASVKIPRGLPKARREALPDTVRDIVNHSESARFGLFGLLLMYSGLRRGEALALRYEDIKDGRIHVNKKLRWENGKPVIDDHTKTSAGMRDVVLLSRLKAALPKKKKGYIFPGSDGGPMHEKEFARNWLDYCRDIGMVDRREKSTGKKDKRGNLIFTTVDAPAITPHQFRHTFATMCYEAEIDVKAASGLLGHSKIAVTQDIYTHISRAKDTDTAAKLNKCFG